MAKQNFIAGGYYGKLGETVGQRWKNIRTIRVYVIPHDPRTPAQLAQRGVFAQGVPYAQQAMRLNHNAPCWNYANKTEWQARMGTAVDRLKRGVSGAAIIPIYPDGYTPDVVFMGISYLNLGGGLYGFKCQSQSLVSENRNAMVVIECNVTGQTETVDIVAEVQLNSTGDNLFVCDLGGYSPKEGGQIYGVTTDDVQHDGSMCYIAIQAMTEAVVIPVSDIAFMGWTSEGLNLSSQTAANIQGTYSREFQFKAWDVVNQSYNDVLADFTVGNGSTILRAATFPPRITLWGESTVKGRDGTSITEGQDTYTFPEIPIIATQEREVPGTAWGGNISFYLTVERDLENGDTLFDFDIVYPFEIPDNVLDEATVRLPQIFGATSKVEGAEVTRNVWFEPGYIDNAGGKTHLRAEAVLEGTLFDFGANCSISMAPPSMTLQNAKILTGVTSGSATVQDA